MTTNSDNTAKARRCGWIAGFGAGHVRVYGPRSDTQPDWADLVPRWVDETRQRNAWRQGFTAGFWQRRHGDESSVVEPDEILRLARQSAEEARRHSVTYAALVDVDKTAEADELHGERIAPLREDALSYYQALDDWVSQGGPLPKAWTAWGERPGHDDPEPMPGTR